jgi:hypothetical protein
MYQIISQWDFVRAFTEMNRESNFSEEGRIALFELLEEVNPDSELDVISICCDFVEYSNLNELKAEYSHLLEDEEFEDDDEVLDFFRDETVVLELSNGGVIIQQF